MCPLNGGRRRDDRVHVALGDGGVDRFHALETKQKNRLGALGPDRPHQGSVRKFDRCSRLVVVGQLVLCYCVLTFLKRKCDHVDVHRHLLCWIASGKELWVFLLHPSEHTVCPLKGGRRAPHTHTHSHTMKNQQCWFFITRSMSRLESRFFISSRLSYFFFPRTEAKPSFISLPLV